jgi:LDH2 family malate/lactate/ureidoglycolate dehydrogenase
LVTPEDADGTELVVPTDRLREFAESVLRGCGMPPEDAAVTADAMVWADLRGLDAHGVTNKLPQCVARIRAGGTSERATFTSVSESAGVTVLEAANAWGQVAGARAMRLAVAKATASGVGLTVARNISSAAAMGYYPMLAVEERMIGIAITNGPSLLAPWGGTTRVLSNMGHAIGAPAGRHDPVLFDSSLSVMSTGEMELLHEHGNELPDGVLLNALGEPSRNPGDWVTGLLLPSGGHRGYGLVLAFEILTGVLAGGAIFAPDVGSPNKFDVPQGVSLLTLAIDPSVSVPYETFVDRVDRLIDRIHESPSAPGVDRVYVPGERGFLLARERQKDGIPLPAARLERLRTLGDEFGVSLA